MKTFNVGDRVITVPRRDAPEWDSMAGFGGVVVAVRDSGSSRCACEVQMDDPRGLYDGVIRNRWLPNPVLIFGAILALAPHNHEDLA